MAMVVQCLINRIDVVVVGPRLVEVLVKGDQGTTWNVS